MYLTICTLKRSKVNGKGMSKITKTIILIISLGKSSAGTNCLLYMFFLEETEWLTPYWLIYTLKNRIIVTYNRKEVSKQHKNEVLPTIPNISPSGHGASIKVRGYNDHITHQPLLELRWVAPGKFTSLISAYLKRVEKEE